MRIRSNFWTGTLSVQLPQAGTTMACAALADFPEVTGGDIAVLALGPRTGFAELVHITAHTAGSTSATVLRGQGGTTARTWVSGTIVIQPPVVHDLPQFISDDNYAAITPDPNTIYVTTGDSGDNASSGSAAQGTTTPPTTGRDVFYWPFASDSVWNLPVGTGAVLESATAAKTLALRTNTMGNSINCDRYSHPLVRASATDPLVTITDWNDGTRSRTAHIPASAQPAPGDDRHLHILQPDGHTCVETWLFEWTGATTASAGRVATSNFFGAGLGPQGGTRAYGGSALGGLIRKWEADPNDPHYTDGVIRHAIALAVNLNTLLYTSGSAGYDANGYGTELGYVWPATEQDYGSEATYSGTVPMGTYCVIPKTVDVASLGLSWAALPIAKAIQDYGAYITDQAGWIDDPWFAVYAEPALAETEWFHVVYNDPIWDAPDIGTIRDNLRIVTNNTAATPNGGGSRPLPLAPGL